MFTQPNLRLARRARRLASPTSLVAALTLILLGCGSVGLAHSQHEPDDIHNAAQTGARDVLLTVAPAPQGKTFALGAVGLSIETQELATRDLSAGHRSLVTLMRLLGPGVLRVGGNSLDYSWWTSDDERRPAWATSVVTPDDLIRLRGLLAATGWQAILGVDLGHFDPTRAASEARVAAHVLGSRLLGFEIGNEPNGYGAPLVKLRPRTYSATDYLHELAAYSAAMRVTAPAIGLYGPDLGSLPPQAWLSAITAGKSTSFAAITQHYYPTTYSFSRGVCKGTRVPTALDLLSPEVRERENAALQTIVGAGDSAGRTTRISETNDTSSCDAPGGPATSPVFASALWSLDWVLRATSAGVAGLNFHGYFGRCLPEAFTPICAPGYSQAADGHVVPRPEYYGLLAARQLEGGQFVPVQISKPSASGALTAYATVHAGGVITLAIDNFATIGATSVLLRVPGYHESTGESLTAPSISATSRVTFGRASFNADGVLRPRAAKVPQVDGAFRLKLAPASAVVVTVRR